MKEKSLSLIGSLEYNYPNMEFTILKILACFCGLWLVCFSSSAQEKKIPAGEAQLLFIKVVHLNLKLKKNKSPVYNIKWKGNLSVKNENGILYVQDVDFNSKKSWRSALKGRKTTLEITGPDIPLKVFASDTNITISNWSKSVFVSGFKGFLTGVKNKGEWKVYFRKGSLELKQHNGSLFIKGFHVNNQIRASQGDFKFHINEGSVSVKQFKGSVNFITDKAKVTLSDLKGNLKGRSQSGNVNVSIKPENMDLFVEDGSTRVSFMGQAPEIKAYTEKGKIYGSSYLYKQFSGKSTTVSGRIRGSSKKGEVFLKSNTGTIYIN